MSNIDKIENIVGKLYDRYIMRDLAHIFAGAFILVVIAYSLEQHEVFFDFISANLVNFIIFLFPSYLLGLLLVEIPAFIYTRKWSRIEYDDHNTDFPEKMKEIENKYGFDPLRLIERFEYLRRIGFSLCSASAISFIIIIVKLILGSYEPIDILIIIGIIFVFFSSLRLFQRMKVRIEDAKQHYIDELKKNQKPCKEKL